MFSLARLNRCLASALLLLVFSTLINLTNVAALTYGAGAYGECLYGGEISDDALGLSVNTSVLNMGTLSVAAAGSVAGNFDISLNCSELGYAVQILGEPLTGSGHTLAALSTPTASSPGTEQFGINLVDNTNPDVGANPQNGIGQAASGYNTADQFKFVSGDVIATATASSAATTFTISFLANISSLTPASEYIGNYTIVGTATY